MADIIAKIGKYFADQESQMREIYAHEATVAAAVSGPATRSTKETKQPTREAVKDRRHTISTTTDEDDEPIERPPSLLRQRLLGIMPLNDGARDDSGSAKAIHLESEIVAKERSSKDHSIAVASLLSSRSDGEESNSGAGSRSIVSTSDAASMSSVSLASSRNLKVAKKKKKKKMKKRKSETSEKDDNQTQNQQRQQQQKQEELKERAQEGLARAQERAKCIQMEKLQQLKQQQQAREANAARLQEEMRKIEEIRQKGKQFALRLRPQSAPSTPQSSQNTLRWTESEEAELQSSGDSGGGQLGKEEPKKRTFLDEMERQMHGQMALELVVNERAHRKYSHDQQEWTRLQAQLKKTADRNAIRTERVRSLSEKKKELENQIQEAQSEALACRQERNQLEEKSKKERQLKQREAEREIHARLRKEESQRLVEEERRQKDDACEARAKAKLRVQSRAALLKRVLHGCDVRAERGKSQNQEEEEEEAKNKSSHLKVQVDPELAEFEEDGLCGDLGMRASPEVDDVASSPRKRARESPNVMAQPATSDVLTPTPFQWRVPSLTIRQIHTILHQDLLTSDRDEHAMVQKQ